MKRIVVGAPPRWQPAWGPAYLVVVEGRLLAVVVILGLAVGVPAGAVAELRLVGRSTLLGHLVTSAVAAVVFALVMRSKRPVRVRSVSTPIEVVERTPARRAPLLLGAGGAGLVTGVLAATAPQGLIGAAILFGSQVSLHRRMRALEAATGGTVVRPLHALRRRSRGSTLHSNLYLVTGAVVPVGQAQVTLAGAPVARPAAPYARLGP